MFHERPLFRVVRGCIPCPRFLGLLLLKYTLQREVVDPITIYNLRYPAVTYVSSCTTNLNSKEPWSNLDVWEILMCHEQNFVVTTYIWALGVPVIINLMLVDKLNEP